MSYKKNHELLYIYSALVIGWTNTEYRHIANASTLAAINMTITRSLTHEDLIKLQSQAKVFRLQHFLFLISAVIISLISGLFGIKSFGYWISVAATLSFLVLLYLAIFVIDFIAFRKDLKDQEKICATITVVSKSVKENDFVFTSDFKELKKVKVFTKNVFDQIANGDNLYVEFTSHSKYLLKLEKNGQNILDQNL